MMKSTALRYAVQHRDGLRWYTAKTYQPAPGQHHPDDDFGFLLACKVASRISSEYHHPARVLLMPGNVLAFQA